METTTQSVSTTTLDDFFCADTEFQCLSSNQCIQFDDLCNKIIDCEDKSDEMYCRCVDYLTKDGNHKHKVCDGIIDCADSSDEHNCDQCHEGMFICTGHQNQCIDMGKVCNGENDCMNGDDEHNCIALVDPDDVSADNALTARSMHGTTNGHLVNTKYSSHGILFIRKFGQWKPLCFDNYSDDSNEVHGHHNRSHHHSLILPMNDMGVAVCKANYYSQMSSIDIVQMDHSSLANMSYYSISTNVSTDLKPSLSL